MKTSKKLISFLMCMLMVLTMVPMSVFATVGPIEIDTINIEGVLAPQYGQTVEDHFDDMIKKGDDGEFKVNGLGYYVCDLFDDMGFSLLDKDKKRLDKSEVIVEGIYYFAMDFLPSDGYVIPNDVAVTLDGALSVEKDFDEDGWLTVWAKFEVKATEIDTIHVEGVPAPLYGQTIESYYEAIEDKITDGTITVNDEVYDSTAYKYGNLVDDGWNVRTEADGPLSSTSTDLIKEGTYYVAMWFLPDIGYVIPEEVNVLFDGAKSVKIEVEDDGCLDIRAEFEVEAPPPIEIDTVHIEGIPAPLYGQTVEKYNTVMYNGSMDGTHKINGSTRVNNGEDIFYGNIELAEWDYYNSEKSSYLNFTEVLPSVYYFVQWLYPAEGYKFPDDDPVTVNVDGAVSVESELDEEGCLAVWAKFEVAPPTEITAVELTVSGYQCGGFANQITFTGSEGTYMIPSTYPVFTDINDFEGTALGKYDGFCRDTEYWVSAAFAAADGYTLPELSKDDITLKGFTVLDKYVSYDATEQTIWVAFKLSAHSFDDDSDNTCNLCNKERYTYTEADGKVTITAYNGLGGAVNIPSTIGGYPVTVIGEEAFCENYGITSVSIPDSVTTIEEDAFYDNELTSVHIGKGVTSIGEDAFAFSAEFETITVDEDNDYYLSENNVLFDIDKEELIVYAVKKTDTSYTVPATVKKIHRAAFNFAKNLKSITISDGVTDIGSFAFSGCNNIASLIIPNSVTSIGSYAFSQMDKLKYVMISDKLTTVSSYAFQFCENLTDVVIPVSVTSIEGGAFRYCPSLSDIYYTGTQAQWENVAVNNNAGYHDKFLSANVHYNAQVVYGHVYDNDCDATCNICGDTRETREHTYTDCEDTTCNGCGKARTAPGHDYYDCYDTTCADCDYIRSDVPDHCFEDPCQPYCSDCGVVNPDATAHTYDGDCDDKCNVCDWCRIPPHSYGGDDTCDLCGKGRFIVLDRIDLTIADDSWMPKIGDVYDYDAYLPTVTIQGNIPFEIGHGDDGWRVYDETTGQWFWMEDGDVFEAGKTYQFWWLCINCEEDDVTTLYRLSEDVKVYVNGQQWSIMNMDDDFWCGTESWHAYVYVTAPAITLCGHTYDNACDAVCNKCEEERTVPAHTYKTYTTKATLSKNGKTESKCTVCGKVKSTQTIAKISSVTLSATKYIHDGKNKTPTVTVKDANGKKLIKNTDYKLSVASSRKGIGKYTVKVTFIGKYSGTKNVYFTILPGKPASVKSAAQTTSSVKLTWSKVSGAAGYTVYRYSPSKKAYVKAGTTEGASLTVKGLLTGTKYTFKVVAYGKTSGGKVYNSEGYTLLKTATKTKTPAISKIATTKGKAVLTHTNVSGETGYTVYYSTKKDSGFKKYNNFKADTTTCNITKLTSGKTYYFKVRTYITTDSGYVYSPWSAVKGIKVK